MLRLKRRWNPWLVVLLALLGVWLVILLRALFAGPGMLLPPTSLESLQEQLPKIETGIPVGAGLPQNLAKLEDNCLPPLGTETAAFYQTGVATTLATVPADTPLRVIKRVDPSNYGQRVSKDAWGKPVWNRLLIVLHETVGDAQGAINTFQNRHTKDAQQVSYHAVIDRDGIVYLLTPPKNRAFGAGDSEFVGTDGPEAVTTNRRLPSSVNNFAYHISLETPTDGLLNDNPSHSGYTEAQYRSLAWLIAHTHAPTSRITTHRAIDRLQSRQDPRSFDYPKLLSYLNEYPRPNDISLCPGRLQG
jgi:hypothetical protein